ncbi:hypothetical protein PRtIB026_A29310 [Pseudomonas sp. RtIB026]|nr:hypothetical protein PRtIB026_A29310 [Pseudomonas sp. RtIB026]
MTTCTRDRLRISMSPTAAITAFMVCEPRYDRQKAGIPATDCAQAVAGPGDVVMKGAHSEAQAGRSQKRLLRNIA